MPARPLPDKTLREACAAVRKAGSIAAAARALGISRSTFEHRIAEARRRGMPDPLEEVARAAPPPKPQDEDERRDLLRLRQENARLRAALEQADHAALDADRFRRLSSELHDRPMPPPDWAVRVPAGEDSPGVPMLLLSDWHIGETVDPAQMHNANRFDAEVAEARVKRLIDRTLYLAFQHVKTPKYPGAVVVLGGDFVSGWLHEELFRTDWCAPTAAANWCVSRLHRILLRLADAFGRLHVAAVPGNHGRLTRKPMAKGGSVACFDHAIYEALMDRLQDDARITWTVPAAGDCILEVANTRYLLMHGHELGVKGGDGIIGALGPIMRGAIKTGRAERSIGRDFDVLLLGHYHQSIWQPRQGIIVNNSLKGWDEYARKSRFAYSPPSQWLFFSHPRFGPNLPFDVFLEDPPQREGGARFVAVAEGGS
jgi:transposase-like protein